MGASFAALIATVAPGIAQTALPNSAVPLLLQNFPTGNPFTVGPGTTIATGAAGIAIQGDNSSNWTLNNQGTVSSDTTAMQFGSATTIVNSGTIAGGAGPAINFGNFNNSVTNTGNITSTGATAILFGSGNDTLNMNGGTIMGTGADNSVVDSYGRTHEIPNLYVAGPGIFPSEGASNPTYTVFALSLRGAEQLAKDWGTIAG